LVVAVGVLVARDGGTGCACAGAAAPNAAALTVTGIASHILQCRPIMIIILQPSHEMVVRPFLTKSVSNR
jgi:hypothetical protein